VQAGEKDGDEDGQEEPRLRRARRTRSSSPRLLASCNIAGAFSWACAAAGRLNWPRRKDLANAGETSERANERPWAMGHGHVADDSCIAPPPQRLASPEI